MKNAIFRLTLLTLIGLTLAACMPRLVPAGAQFLGRRQVTFATERDTLIFPEATLPIRKLVLVVRLNDIEIYGIRVTFENGRDFEVDWKGKFIANRDSQVFDLPGGGAHRIRRIEFRYRSLAKTARRAEVEFWGI
jgi:hypothetical protein